MHFQLSTFFLTYIQKHWVPVLGIQKSDWDGICLAVFWLFFFATKHQLDFILSHTWFCQVAKSRPEYITLDCTTRKHFWWTREKNIKLFISEGLNEDLKHLQWNAANTQSQHFPKSLSGTTILIHGQKPKKLLRSFWL